MQVSLASEIKYACTDRDTYTENKHMDANGEMGVVWIEMLELTYTIDTMYNIDN